MAGFDNEVLFSPGERLEVSSALNIQSMQQVSTDVSRVNHTGDPNLSVAANPSSLSHDPVSGFLWLKVSGTGITQWNRIFAGSNSPVFTLEGNVGGKIPPDGTGNINIITSDTTTQFAGSGNTLTVEYNLSNLVFGSSLPSIAGAVRSVGVGAGCLNAMTSATDTCAVGTSALTSLTSGSSNSALGSGALASLTSGTQCCAFGNGCLFNSVIGLRNCGFGYATLSGCTSNDNTAFGHTSMFTLTTGIFNVGCGSRTIYSNVGGSNNTAAGYEALDAMTGGSDNIAIGYLAGNQYLTNESSNIVIGNIGTVTESNVIRIGTAGTGAGQQSSCYIAGIYGVTVASSFPVGINANGQLSQLSATALSITSVAHAASPYTVLSTDEFLAVQSSGGAITIKLPNAPATGRVITIKDSNGAANANPISVTTVGGAVTIDGATTYTMNTNYAAINVIFDGAAYEVF